jgi:hypothetical protein
MDLIDNPSLSLSPFVSVVLALVLFSSGIARQFRARRVRLFLLAVAALLLACGVTVLLVIPSAHVLSWP